MPKAASTKPIRPRAMTPHVALLRGINIGGKNKLPMAALAEMFAHAGGADVRTYIQSGNVVFLAAPATAKRIPGLVSQQIRVQFRYEIPVVIRTAAEVRAAVAANPFLDPDVDPKRLFVGFLADKPSRSRVDKLDPERSPPDEFRVVGREIYMRLVNGAADTKLTNSYFDRTLGTISTMRNWRTVLKLVEMTSAIG